MSSVRKIIPGNENDSKNTRMRISEAFAKGDYRKDELMHVARYLKFATTAIGMAQRLGRPIRVLDIGCGEIYCLKTFYRSFVCKKADVIAKYIGVDIDSECLDKVKRESALCLQTCNGKVFTQDLTVRPKLKVSDRYFDLVVCFEMIEHINPKFVRSILDEVDRVLSSDGVFLLSTPNATGSNSKLPKDHFHEWGYEELCEILEQVFVLKSSVGVGLNPSKVPKEFMPKKSILEALDTAFDRKSPFYSVALAPHINPKYCKNVLYTLTKEGQQ